MTITQNFVAKLAVAFVAVAMAFTLVAPVAQAQYDDMSTEDLVALIQQLLGQQSSSSVGSCDYTFTVPMGMGSTGADVKNLQQFLNMDAETRVSASGVGSAGQESMYYGALTAAAVSKFQTKYRSEVLTPLGLVNATGYFGNSSITKANAICAEDGNDDNDSTGSGSSALEGGAGSIDDVDYITSLNNEEVGEDEEDVEVAGIEIEADGSDIEIRAVNLNFSDVGSTNNDDDLDEYADEISVWFNGEEVARLDADKFEDDDSYTKTVSLDRGAIVREGDTGELVVAVSGISNLDNASAGDSWSVEFESVRFLDAQGATITDSTTGDINDGSGRTFTFETFATAADTELKIREDDDDVNDAQTVQIDTNDETEDVALLSFTIEVEGDSDVVIEDLPVFLTASGFNIDDGISAVKLVMDGDEVDSNNVSSLTGTTGTTTFTNIDLDLEAGETYEFLVTVDINSATAASFASGDSIMAEIRSAERDSLDAEDESGETIVVGDKSGTALGEAHTLATEGVMISEGASDSTDTKDTNGDTAGGEQGLFTINFEVTAFEDTIYIPTGATSATGTVTAASGVSYAVENSDGDQVEIGAAAASSTAAVSSSADKSGNYFVVEDGQTETFTLNVTFTPMTDGYYRGQLDGVNFNVGAAGSADTREVATPQNKYETAYEDLDAI